MNDKLVLVVDDNKDFLESTVWMLEGVGYEAKGFDNSEVALDAVSYTHLTLPTICSV